MTIEFFEPMRIPSATHQDKQVAVIKGRPHFYEPAAVRDARAKYMAYLGRHVPKQPLDGPVCLDVAFEYHSDKMAQANDNSIRWKTTKPDTDNMVKLVKDCMTALGYWHDDAQVCLETVQKYFHKFSEGIYIRVVSIDGKNKKG